MTKNPQKNKGSQQTSSGVAPRLIVVEWLFDVLRRKHSLDEVFAQSETDKSWQTLLPRDRAFARSLLMTVLRHKGELEWIISKFLKKPPQAKSRVNEILLMGVAQLLYMEVSAHAAIDTSVRLAKNSDKSRHLAKLVNAILRQVSRAEPAELVPSEGAAINIPALWRTRWEKQYGPEIAAKIETAILEPAALDIIVKKDAPLWAETLDGHVFGASAIQDGFGLRKEHRGLVTELEGFTEGAWWIQDFSAHLPCTLFETAPGFGTLEGKKIADLCAAPGGKTAALVNKGADVTAVDISEGRLQRLKENLTRLNLEAEIVTSDVLNFEPETLFDALLLDAPCSATGTIRRHPDILYLKSESVIFELRKIQRQMLEKAVTLLKPGGLLIYCTCSLEHEEGEQQIDRFVKTNPNIERVPVRSEEISGQQDWLTESGDVRLLPYYTPFSTDVAPGMDGFFISRLRVK